MNTGRDVLRNEKLTARDVSERGGKESVGRQGISTQSTKNIANRSHKGIVPRFYSVLHSNIVLQ